MSNRYVWGRGSQKPSLVNRATECFWTLLLLATIAATGGGCDLRGIDPHSDDRHEADIEVINGTGATWVGLRFKDHRASEWGIDELRGLTVKPGGSFVIRDVQEAETFDVWVTDVDGFDYEADVHVGFRDEVLTVRDGDLSGGVGVLRLRNTTEHTWSQVYVVDRQASGGDGKWGVSLAQGPVAPGATLVLDRPIWSSFNVRAVADNKAVYQLIDLPMNAKAKTVSVSETHRVTEASLSVINGIDYGNAGDNSIIAVFFRPTTVPAGGDWGTDHLPGAISNGGAAEFELVPGAYGIRVVDVSGQTYQVMGVSVLAGWPEEVVVTVQDRIMQAP